MRKNLVVTGKPGIGKSTLIKRVIHALESKEAGGFLSSEIREGNRRVGFSIDTLKGESGILAHIDLKKGPRIGKYRVNIEDIEKIAVPALVRARRAGGIIVIDEIASMELYSHQFAPEVRKCLDTRKVLASLQHRRGTFQDEVGSRDDVDLIEITLSNRDSLSQEIISRLMG